MERQHHMKIDRCDEWKSKQTPSYLSLCKMPKSNCNCYNKMEGDQRERGREIDRERERERKKERGRQRYWKTKREIEAWRGIHIHNCWDLETHNYTREGDSQDLELPSWECVCTMCFWTNSLDLRGSSLTIALWRMGRKRLRNDSLDGLLSLHGALASSSHAQPKSVLVDLLLRKLFWGEVPAILVQQICEAALQDGVELAEVKAIAHVGTSGLHSGDNG